MKTPIPFGEWRPDVALLDSNQFASEAKNVLPGVNSYIPLSDLAGVTTVSTENGGNDSSTKVLLHFDGTDTSTTITDDNTGGSAHTWTAAGNAQLDTAQFKFGGTASLLCDGTGDWVSTPDHANFTVSANFTVDFWVRPAADGTALNIAGQGNTTTTAATTPWYFARSAGNKMTFNISNGSAFTTITGTTNIIAGAWYHIEGTRSGNNIYLFVNGALEAGPTAFSGTPPNSTNALHVGAAGENTGNPWNGWIDEFRLSVGTARHTAAFTPPTGPFFIGGVCRGLTVVWALGAYKIYAGTATRLLRWSGTDWTDVSRLSGGNYALATGHLWAFQESGTNLVAVHLNDVAQVIDTSSGTNFAALGGSPPQSGLVSQVGDFLVLGGVRTIQWSAVNDITGWTVGTNLSDNQVFPDLGAVKGVAGGEIGYVLQEGGVRLMQFLPGDTDRIFAFSKAQDGKGCASTYGWVRVSDTLYFLSSDGFYAMVGAQLIPIGAEKIDEWFLANSDSARRFTVLAFTVPNEPIVGWAFHNSSSSTEYDRIVLYNWNLQRWVHADISAQVWAPITVNAGNTFVLGAVDEDGILSTLNGPALAATLDTVEVHLSPGMRTFVNDAYPLVDVSSATVTAGTRERLGDTTSFGTAVAMETNGACPVLSSSRLHKFRLSIPAAATWTHAEGVAVNAQSDGEA